VYNARFEVHIVGLVKIQTDWNATLFMAQCRIPFDLITFVV